MTVSSTASTASAGTSASLASDSRGLDNLRLTAQKDPKAAVREAAKQFEALFTSELLKTMRASSEGTMTDNEGTKLGTQLLDSQLSTQLAGRPGGLADVITRQLERQMGISPGPIPATPGTLRNLPLVTTPANTPRIPTTSAADFVQQHSEAAQAASATSGIPATFMLAQAGHETGWGRKAVNGDDGTVSNNLFGIKAGANWKGATVDVTTTEYIGGQPRKLVQKFRAYASEAESFADYAKLIGSSPRYAGVVAAGGNAQAFAQGLQKAGYATDPAYADKLGKAITTAQRALRSTT
ncbi:MAG: flagellar assembly peptidoglycan hydrolase FlgJ [Burkholderiales bacterium PBB5]|nr:MAG: flagellar assembly peptidoglycan hydrolase FlgJ [Burkholderiales bacterium PBB5]